MKCVYSEKGMQKIGVQRNVKSGTGLWNAKKIRKFGRNMLIMALCMRQRMCKGGAEEFKDV